MTEPVPAKKGPSAKKLLERIEDLTMKLEGLGREPIDAHAMVTMLKELTKP